MINKGRDIYNSLPTDVRRRFKKNFFRDNRTTRHEWFRYMSDSHTYSSFFIGAFPWLNSEEGQEYWRNLSKRGDNVSVPKKTTWKMERFTMV